MTNQTDLQAESTRSQVQDEGSPGLVPPADESEEEDVSALIIRRRRRRRNADEGDAAAAVAVAQHDRDPAHQLIHRSSSMSDRKCPEVELRRSRSMTISNLITVDSIINPNPPPDPHQPNPFLSGSSDQPPPDPHQPNPFLSGSSHQPPPDPPQPNPFLSGSSHQPPPDPPQSPPPANQSPPPPPPPANQEAIQPRLLSLNRIRACDKKLEILGSLNKHFTAIVALGLGISWSTSSILNPEDGCNVTTETMKKVLTFGIASFMAFVFSTFIAYTCRTILADWIATEEDLEMSNVIDFDLTLLKMAIGLSLIGTCVGSCLFVAYLIFLFEVRLGRIECNEDQFILMMCIAFVIALSLVAYCAALVRGIYKYGFKIGTPPQQQQLDVPL